MSENKLCERWATSGIEILFTTFGGLGSFERTLLRPLSHLIFIRLRNWKSSFFVRFFALRDPCCVFVSHDFSGFSGICATSRDTSALKQYGNSSEITKIAVLQDFSFAFRLILNELGFTYTEVLYRIRVSETQNGFSTSLINAGSLSKRVREKKRNTLYVVIKPSSNTTAVRCTSEKLARLNNITI